MLKASGQTKAGEPIVMLGLTPENWARLMADQPIRVWLDELDPRLPRIAVVLLGGPTGEAMAAQLHAAFPGLWVPPSGPAQAEGGDRS